MTKTGETKAVEADKKTAPARKTKAVEAPYPSQADLDAMKKPKVDQAKRATRDMKAEAGASYKTR